MNVTYYLKVVALLMYTLLIGYVSSLDGADPNAEALDLNKYAIAHLDKILHFAAYAVFSVLAIAIFKTKRQVISICIIIILYGLVLELYQGTMPEREASFADFFANTVGVIFGALCMVRANSIIEISLSNQRSKANL